MVISSPSAVSRVAHGRLANAIRALAMDAVEQAKSGHPGLPMGAADVATVLFTRFLKFDAAAPQWPDRDRFVLSAGHGSMMLYALLHLLGYGAMTIDEIKRFRQLGSATAGHPEYGHAPGIETTTGPLGQGLANAVGMAIAERHLAAEFGADVVDHRTYVLASDGDLMEGISQEAIALAGHLKLARLIVLFDDNGISIDGPLSLADSVDQVKRFEACGWNACRVDGHDPDAIAAAITAAQTSDRPSLIACRTVIGFGAPTKAGSEKSHGSPLGPDEVKGAREKLGWTSPPFEVPADIAAAWREAGARSRNARLSWEQRLASLAPDRRVEFDRRIAGDLPAEALAAAVRGMKEKLAAAPKEIATRVASEQALDALAAAVPEMVGGSADLTGSNNTRPKGMAALTAANPGGRFIHYGIREHGMAAAMNGMALHGGIIPYSGTFLVFSDYMRPSIRLAALMGLRVIHVLTHDFDRPRRGRPDPPAGRASRGAAGDPQPAGVPALRYRRDGGVLGARARSPHLAQRARAHPAEPAPAAHRLHGGKPLRRRRLRAVAGGRDGAGVAVRLGLRGRHCRGGARAARRARRRRPGGVGALFRAVPRRPGGRAAAGGRHRAGPDRHRGGDPPGLGRRDRLRRPVRRHERHSAPAAPTRTSTATSALPPSTSPRRRSPSCPRVEILHWNHAVHMLSTPPN